MFAVFMAFLAPILHSFCNLLDSHFANNLIKSNSAVIFYNSLTNVLVIPVLFLFGVPQAITWEEFPFLVIIAATETFYLLPYYHALRRIDASVTSALFSLSGVLIPIMAWFLVDEKLSIMQYFGFGVIIAASIALNLEHPRKKCSDWLVPRPFRTRLDAVFRRIKVVLFPNGDSEFPVSNSFGDFENR